jgi:hypothetical protein
MSHRIRPDNASILRKQIRQQFGSAGTMRFLRSLPQFRVDHRMPERLRNLLTELERIESDGNGSAAGKGTRG